MRGWLYSSEKPEGELFDDADYAAALASGWVDSPALIGEEPPRKKPGRPRKDQA